MSRIPSWLDEPAKTDFPIENLPFGVARLPGEDHAEAVTRIGNTIISLAALELDGFFDGILHDDDAPVFDQPHLNAFMGLGPEVRRRVRGRLIEGFRADTATLKDNPDLLERCLFNVEDVVMQLPAQIGDYTDFYSSREHATNVGSMFRGADNALMPNWLHLPVGYHGRASSVVVSGTPIIRPHGQTKADDAEMPTFGPSRLLDIELEMGYYIGSGNALGAPVSIDNAADHIFGLSLVNDWSARDIQKWEYVPLGPFLAKNFATTVSPWVITPEALEPFRCEGPTQDPEPLPYLKVSGPSTYDIKLEVLLKTPNMSEPMAISRTNFKRLYWSMAQQIAHHTVTGCNLRPGDLLASGTISGPTRNSCGSLLEITWRGTEPIKLPNGEERKFLLDGDEVILRGWCEGDGYRIGFGECSGSVYATTPC
jgi:fumarylacetoacetase